MKPKINLVVITSVVNTRTQSVFSAQDRFEQLFKSISSVKNKIPDVKIILIEGSVLTEQQVVLIKNKEVEIFYCTEKYLEISRDKQTGEASLLYHFFTSNLYLKYTNEYEIKSIHKLSGRYYLTDKYHYTENDICICKIENPSWSGHPQCLTRYYCFPREDLLGFLKGLQHIMPKIFINIEHSFYKYNVLPIHKINENKTVIGVAGYLSPNGEYIED